MDKVNTSSFNLRTLYIIGAWAALLQLASILALLIAQMVLGPKPATAEEFFTIQQSSYIEVMLRGDFLLLFLVGAYLGTFPALFMALRSLNSVAVFFATLFTMIGVALVFANESTFALLHLGKQYAVADSVELKSQIIAAGEAVIAMDMWNSSGAYMSGFLAQGAGVIICIIILNSKDFSKVTAIAGLIGNVMDLIQHAIHPFTHDLSTIIHPLMGIFYCIWLPMMARDLFRLVKATKVPGYKTNNN